MSFHIPPLLNCDDKRRSYINIVNQPSSVPYSILGRFFLHLHPSPALLWRSSGVFTQLFSPSSFCELFLFCHFIPARVVFFERNHPYYYLPSSHKISQKEEKSVISHASITVLLLRDTRILLPLPPSLCYFSSCCFPRVSPL